MTEKKASATSASSAKFWTRKMEIGDANELHKLAKKSLDYGEVDPNHHFTHYCRYNYGLVAIAGAQKSTDTSTTTNTSTVADGTIIGYLIGKLDDEPDREAINRKKINIVYWLVVHPDYRRIGIGENLLQQILTVVDTPTSNSTAGVSTSLSTLESPYADKPIYLYVRTKNTAAFELYLKLGFTIVRRILNFYAASDTLGADDAYFMVRSPIPVKIPVAVSVPTSVQELIPTPIAVPTPTSAPKSTADSVPVPAPDLATLRIPVSESVSTVETILTRESSVEMKTEEDEVADEDEEVIEAVDEEAAENKDVTEETTEVDEIIYSSENIPIRPAKKAKKIHAVADVSISSISSVSISSNSFASLASESSDSGGSSDDDDGK